ncbi:serine protease [Culex quinquefasciatus]|uniref:Serine protease n=1 Tax=Culex quinquefasciatus TaxID=7176 RepID=B0XIP4_CULQU|nr:serine protease [Culex quinquefasciatus]|eukprot:XP_001869516.1 serine protease [Culex quinquefasciatus]
MQSPGDVAEKTTTTSCEKNLPASRTRRGLAVESVGIDWSQVRPIEDSDQYWVRLPQELQYLRKHQPDHRIVNGEEAVPGQFPYQVFLLSRGAEGNGSCGGSILNSNSILTAAHCVFRAKGGIAILGAHNLEVNEPTQQIIAYAKVFFHANYNPDTLENDIAVVRLNSHMTFNDRVQPVRLPARGDNRQFTGMTGTVSGFGAICSGCESSDVLLYTFNTIITNADCALKNPIPEMIQPSNLCVSVDGGRDACQGDSGGPLTVVDGGSSLQVMIVNLLC